MKAKLVRESLNEDLSFAPHDLVIAILGVISIVGVPWIINKIKQHKEVKRIKAAEKAARDLEIKEQTIIKNTLNQLKKNKEFKDLLKEVLKNPIEGKPEMFLKNRRFMKGKELEKQPIRKDKREDYDAMQKNRANAIDNLEKFLTSILSDEQKSLLKRIVNKSIYQ